MSNRSLAVLNATAIVTMVLSLMTGLAHGQPAGDVPRTAWGDPDLQGVWNNNTVVPLQRPADLAERETLTDEEVAERFQRNSDRLFTARDGDPGFYNEFWFEYGRDTNRTSLIIDRSDGRLPALTPLAEERRVALTAHRRERYQAPESFLDLNPYDRCITRGLPGAMMPGFYNHNYHILQTPDHVVLVVEMTHDARIIPLDGRPHASPHIGQWLGDSRGRWEGDTLVVETTNLTDKIAEHGVTVFGIGEHVRLVERFTRVDADTIDYRFTVEDTTTFTDDWTAAIPMSKIEGPVYEYACHEGNYAVPNMLRGARLASASP